MKRLQSLLLFLFLALGAAACATTGSGNGGASPEQAALDQEYNQLKEKKAAIEKKTGAVRSKSKKLYKRATSLEKTRKLARKTSSALVPKGKSAAGKAYEAGPLKLDEKSARFDLTTGAGKAVSGGKAFTLTIKPR